MNSSLYVAIVATRWLPNRTPASILNARLLGALDWTGCVYLPDTKVEGFVSLPLPHQYRVIKLSVPFSSGFSSRIMRRLGLHQCPDRLIAWSFQVARRVVKDVRVVVPDLLVTLGKHDSAHVVGLLVHRKFPQIPWVAVFSDPWVDLEQFGYIQFKSGTVRWINMRLEAAVVSSVDRLIVTSEETRALFAARYPAEVASKIHAVPSSYDQRLFQLSSTGFPRLDNKLIIRYLGDFYGPRSPKPLLEALRSLWEIDPACANSIQIELIGRFRPDDADDCRELMRHLDNVHLLDDVEYLQALKLMVDSDVLLVIDAPAKVSPFLPSKLVEYIGANRPILGLTSPGPSRTLIERANGLVADVRNREEIVKVLIELCNICQSAGLESLMPPPELRREFEVRQVSQRFENIVSPLLN